MPDRPIQLSWDQVLAFRLERHFLSRRAAEGNVVPVTGALCGLHAQLASSPELALCARVEGVAYGAVKRALEEERTLVKTWTLRDTVHVVPADDLALYVAVLRPRPEGPSDGWMHQRGITRDQYFAIIENVPRALDARPRTREQLADRLVELSGREDVRGPALQSWGGALKMSARLGDLCFGPSRGRNVTFIRPDRWLGRALHLPGPEDARREFMRRVLATYGVASYDDLHRWIESTRIAKELLQADRDELVQVEVDGRAAWAHADDVEALSARRRPRGLHLLPAFDPYILAPRPREAFVPTASSRHVFRPQGRVAPVVLVDGCAAGIWSYELRDTQMRVDVEPLAELRPKDRKTLNEEVERLAAFMGVRVELALAD